MHLIKVFGNWTRVVKQEDNTGHVQYTNNAVKSKLQKLSGNAAKFGSAEANHATRLIL